MLCVNFSSIGPSSLGASCKTALGVFTDKQIDKQTQLPKTLIRLTRMVCVNFSSIGSVVLEKVEHGFMCFYGQTDRQTDTLEKRIKYPKTIAGQTRILCVNLSAIGLIVLEKVTKKPLCTNKKKGQLDRQVEKRINRSTIFTLIGQIFFEL